MTARVCPDYSNSASNELNPMRIFYMASSILPSQEANSVHVMKMSHALAKRGHDVTLYAPNRWREREPGVSDVFDFYGVDNIFRLKRFPHNYRFSYQHPLSLVLSQGYLLKEMLLRRPQLVYGRDLFGCRLAARLGFPTMFEAHGPLRFKEGSPFDKAFKELLSSPNLRRIVVNTGTLKDILVQDTGVSAEKVLSAHNACDEVRDHSFPDFVPGRADAVKVCYAGNLYRGRGIELLIRLAEIFTDMDFHILGGTEEDVRHWKPAQDGGNIFFHGYKPHAEVQRYLNASDVLIAPYQRQVFTRPGDEISSHISPVKLFEYMASRKAILTTALPSICEVFNERNAMLVDPTGDDAWIAALDRLRDKPTRDRLAEQAYQDFQRGHTWEKRVDAVLQGLGLD